MVLDGGHLAHRRFRDLVELLRPSDLLVLNETRVIAARLFGRREPGGGRCEVLLLHPARSVRYEANASRWIALTRPAKRLLRGARVVFEPFGEATVREEL
jgi:S-adenosylmethionine:tRNA ribosyltransferase-isomerase